MSFILNKHYKREQGCWRGTKELIYYCLKLNRQEMDILPGAPLALSFCFCDVFHVALVMWSCTRIIWGGQKCVDWQHLSLLYTPTPWARPKGASPVTCQCLSVSQLEHYCSFFCLAVRTELCSVCKHIHKLNSNQLVTNQCPLWLEDQVFADWCITYVYLSQIPSLLKHNLLIKVNCCYYIVCECLNVACHVPFTWQNWHRHRSCIF